MVPWTPRRSTSKPALTDHRRYSPSMWLHLLGTRQLCDKSRGILIQMCAVIGLFHPFIHVLDIASAMNALISKEESPRLELVSGKTLDAPILLQQPLDVVDNPLPQHDGARIDCGLWTQETLPLCWTHMRNRRQQVLCPSPPQMSSDSTASDHTQHPSNPFNDYSTRVKIYPQQASMGKTPVIDLQMRSLEEYQMADYKFATASACKCKAGSDTFTYKIQLSQHVQRNGPLITSAVALSSPRELINPRSLR